MASELMTYNTGNNPEASISLSNNHYLYLPCTSSVSNEPQHTLIVALLVSKPIHFINVLYNRMNILEFKSL